MKALFSLFFILFTCISFAGGNVKKIEIVSTSDHDTYFYKIPFTIGYLITYSDGNQSYTSNLSSYKNKIINLIEGADFSAELSDFKISIDNVSYFNEESNFGKISDVTKPINVSVVWNKKQEIKTQRQLFSRYYSNILPFKSFNSEWAKSKGNLVHYKFVDRDESISMTTSDHKYALHGSEYTHADAGSKDIKNTAFDGRTDRKEKVICVYDDSCVYNLLYHRTSLGKGYEYSYAVLQKMNLITSKSRTFYIGPGKISGVNANRFVYPYDIEVSDGKIFVSGEGYLSILDKHTFKEERYLSGSSFRDMVVIPEKKWLVYIYSKDKYLSGDEKRMVGDYYLEIYNYQTNKFLKGLILSKAGYYANSVSEYMYEFHSLKYLGNNKIGFISEARFTDLWTTHINVVDLTSLVNSTNSKFNLSWCDDDAGWKWTQCLGIYPIYDYEYHNNELTVLGKGGDQVQLYYLNINDLSIKKSFIVGLATRDVYPTQLIPYKNGIILAQNDFSFLNLLTNEGSNIKTLHLPHVYEQFYAERLKNPTLKKMHDKTRVIDIKAINNQGEFLVSTVNDDSGLPTISVYKFKNF